MEQAERLIRLRKERGLSQAEVAEELGVTRQAVSRWESGRAFPTMEKQLALSQLYRVSVEELYQEKEDEEKAASPVGDEPKQSTLEEDAHHGKCRSKKKRNILFAVLVLTYVSVYAVGILTHSKSMAVSTLRFLTAVIIFAWLLYSLYRVFKAFKRG